GRDPAGVVSLRERLEGAGQGHLADALDRLPEDGRERLRAQVEALDLELIARLVRELVVGEGPPPLGRIEPLAPEDVIGLPRDEADEAREREARAAGEELLA